MCWCNPRVRTHHCGSFMCDVAREQQRNRDTTERAVDELLVDDVIRTALAEEGRGYQVGKSAVKEREALLAHMVLLRKRP